MSTDSNSRASSLSIARPILTDDPRRGRARRLFQSFVMR
jgi:hypothetical protein